MTVQQALIELQETFEAKAVELCQALRAQDGPQGDAGFRANVPILCGRLPHTTAPRLLKEVV
jgi:hypothetical protein